MEKIKEWPVCPVPNVGLEVICFWDAILKEYICPKHQFSIEKCPLTVDNFTAGGGGIDG